MPTAAPTKWTSAASGVLGVWLLVSPFVLATPLIDGWNDLVVGGGIATFAAVNYAIAHVNGMASQRISVLILVGGGWLLVSPFVYNVSGIALWSDLFVGVLITAFSGYNGYVSGVAKRSVTRDSSNANNHGT